MSTSCRSLEQRWDLADSLAWCVPGWRTAPCVGISNHAHSLVITRQTKSPMHAWRASISFLAYVLHHRYIVRAHCPPAYLICYLLLCLDLPRSFYPFYLVFNTLIYKFPFSLASTSVRCTHTTTEVSYIFTSLPTQANPYIVPFSIGKSNTVRCTRMTTEFLSR